MLRRHDERFSARTLVKDDDLHAAVAVALHALRLKARKELAIVRKLVPHGCAADWGDVAVGRWSAGWGETERHTHTHGGGRGASVSNDAATPTKRTLATQTVPLLLLFPPCPRFQ